MSLSAAATKSLANEVSKRTISSVFEFLVNKYSLLDMLKFKDNYLDYCDKVLKIKTLLSPDEVFHVDQISVPIDIQKTGTKTKLAINDVTALDDEKAILIKGLAGQGKSTLLRKLLSNNSKRFDRLPIFFELKNYHGGTLERSITKSLNDSGVKLTEYALESLLSDSNVKVYLDAFDETKPEYRTELLDEIKRLVNRFNCHVICTTRPDTEIDTLSVFETYHVCELTEFQVFGIIKKNCTDQSKANELCGALKKSPMHSQSDSILKSPILVILFCISYNLGEEIPSTLSQFYSNIFDTVFFRHDNIKGKVRRERHWNDDRRIYKELFDCLCFISLRSGFNSFKKDQLVEFIADSLDYLDETKSVADKLANELCTITNLIIEDGFNEYRYVHKSIQEFFAASFIMSLQHEKKIKFYEKCFSEHDFYAIFSNALFFLEELDYYDFNEYGLIPAICNTFNLDGKTKVTNGCVPLTLKNTFLERFQIKIKKNIFKTGKKESVDYEFQQFTLDNSSSFPELHLMLFGFSIAYLDLKFTGVDLINLYSKQKSSSEDGFVKLTLREVLKFKKIDEVEAEASLQLGFDVLFRKRYDKAIGKLNNRKISLNKSGYFDF